MLMASTFGEGDFVIRLNNSAIPTTDDTVSLQGPQVASVVQDTSPNATATILPTEGGATEINSTVTITTTTAHGFTVGEQVIVNGVSIPGYNGTWTIASVPTPTTFTYTDTTSLMLPSQGGNVEAVNPSLNGFTVTFAGSVDPNSVNVSDVAVYLPGASGQASIKVPITVASLTDITPVPTNGTGNQHNVYAITFANGQTIAGIYTVVLTGFRDNAGDVMTPYTAQIGFPSPTVTGLTPTSGLTVGGGTVIISGTNLFGATQVLFGKVPATSFTVNSTTQITAVAPPEAAGVYDVTVTTKIGTSVTVLADRFTVAVLGTATPIAPKGAISATPGYDTPTFTWTTVTGAVYYDLYIADNLSPHTSVIGSPTAGLVINATSTSSLTTYVDAAGLTPGHSYTWYVGSESSKGANGPVYWTGPTTFSLAALPNVAPTPVSPAGIIPLSPGFDTPTFVWTAPSGPAIANHYYLYVLDTTTGKVAYANANVFGTSYVDSAGLTPGHTFAWYIGAESTNNGAIVWSGPQGFSLPALTGIPTLGAPSGILTATSVGYDAPTFTWSAVPDAAHYYLYVLDLTTKQPVINNANVNGTAYVATGGLTPGHSFQWYVAAESTNNAVVNFNPNPGSFSLGALLAPTQNGPSGTIAAVAGFDTPTFSWSNIQGAAHYYLYVLDNTTKQAVVNNAGIAAGTTSFVDAAGLTPGHSFTWYIASEATNGAAFFSGPKNFTLNNLSGAPKQLGPIGTTATTAPTFTWSMITGANRYYLYLVDNSTGQIIINNSNVFTNTFGATGLVVGHKYTWYVAAESTDGAQYWSGPQSFTVT